MNEVSVFEAFEIAWRRKLLILVIVAVATTAAYFISEAQPDLYTAETTLVFPRGGPDMSIPGLGPALSQALARMPGLAGGLDGVPTSTAVLQPLLKSRTLAERVVRACDLTREYETGSLAGAAGLLKRDTSISQDLNGAMVISVKAKSPRLASEIANCYVSELQQLAEEKIDLSMLRRSQAFVDGQLVGVRRRLRNAEERLRRFQESNRIVALPEEASAAVRHVADLEKERSTTQIALQGTNAKLAEIHRQVAAQTSQPLAELPAHSPVIQTWREKLVDLNAQLALAQQEFTDENPTVQSLKAQIRETERQIEREVARVRRSLGNGLAPELTPHEVERISLQAKQEAVGRALESLERDFARLPSASLQLARLTRDQQVQEALYTMLTSEREKLNLLAAREGPAFVVLDPAVAPEGRVSPRPKLIAILAGILSFVVAMTLAFFVEYAERARYARGKRAYLAQDEAPRPTHAVHRA